MASCAGILGVTVIEMLKSDIHSCSSSRIRQNFPAIRPNLMYEHTPLGTNEVFMFMPCTTRIERTIRSEARLHNRPKCYGRLHSAIHEYSLTIPLAKRLHVSPSSVVA